MVPIFLYQYSKKGRTDEAYAGDEECGSRHGAVEHLVGEEFILLRQAEALYDATCQILQGFGRKTRMQIFVISVQSFFFFFK